MNREFNIPPGGVLEKFFKSHAFFRGIRGPVGSGKSAACCMEIMRRASQQFTFKGKKRSSWAVIRNTYSDLKNTTLATWQYWFEGISKVVYSHPIEVTVSYVPKFIDKKFNISGVRIELKLYFLAMDHERDVRKLKSFELTGAWMNEAVELRSDVLEMLTTRIGRYPAKDAGGWNWSGIIADTNSCDIGNWWYELDEKKPDMYEFYSQPPALLFENGKYRDNPVAENIVNHVEGYGYYHKMLHGKPKQWVDIYIMNKYGSPHAAQLVYADYSEENITDREFDPGKAIIWSHDFNFTPMSSVIMQVDGENIYAVDEIVLESAVAKQAALEFCDRYNGFRGQVYLYGDASGHVGEKHGHASDYVVLQQELSRNGFQVQQKVPRSNPSIRDGQASLNAKICDAVGNRTFFVNKARCKTLHKGLSALRLKEGSTFQEENAYYQHITTAVRYYTAVEFPIKKRVTGFTTLMG